MSYASARLAMCSSHNPLSSKGLGSRSGIIIYPDGLHFTRGYEVEYETRLNNEVDGDGLWVDAVT